MSEKAKSIIVYIFGWIGGAIVLFGMKDSESNTKMHAAQSIVISVGYIIIRMIYYFIPVTIPFFSTILSGIWILFIILGIVKANNGENPELPVVGGIAKSIFGKYIEG